MTWEVSYPLGLSIESPIQQLLKDRGLDAETFLNPNLDQLHDPLLMKDMERAVKRTVQAINHGERIRIMGDYDADGISSTYTGVTLLTEAGADVSYDIPERKDGYGLSNKMIEKAYKDGCSLLITCDNGIACFEQVEFAKTLGIDVIITDHHEPQEVIPDTIVVNPKQKDCDYPFKELAGCAVIWKFCQAVLSHYGMSHKMLEVIEIVALGTVADVMDLVDENRVIVSFGLQAYRNTQIPGLAQLMKEMDLLKYPVTATTLGYSLGPAFNATGRLVSAHDGVLLLLERSRLKSIRNAQYLAELNNERKEWTERYTNLVLEQIQGTQDKVVVFAQPDIPEGILGIIASRLMNQYHRPILLMSLDESGTFYKGSGRSVQGYDLFENLMRHKDLFKSVGGHGMACGFSIEAANVSKLRDILNQECTLTEEQLIPKLFIDYDIEPEHLNVEFAEELTKLEPYGKGNNKPIFRLLDCAVLNYRYIGKNGKTLKLTICTPEGQDYDCIGFNMVDKFKSIVGTNNMGVYVNLAFYPSVNEWNGRRSLQLELQDIQLESVNTR